MTEGTRSLDSSNSSDAAQPLFGGRSTLFAANIDQYEYELGIPDKSVLESMSSESGLGSMQSNLRNLFTALGQMEIKELQGGGVAAGNNTDCLLCGWGPGDTSKYNNDMKLGGQCLTMEKCGSSMNETLQMAQDVSDSSANPDATFATREFIRSTLRRAWCHVCNRRRRKDRVILVGSSFLSRLTIIHLTFLMTGMKDALDSVGGSSAEGWLQKFEGLEGILAAHGISSPVELLQPGSRRKLQESVPTLTAAGTYHPDSLPLVYTAWFKVAVYCSYNDPGKSSDLLRDCTDYTQVKTVVKQLVAGVNAYRALTVYPDAIDDLFTEYIDPNYVESLAPPYEQSCPGYAVFHVIINSISKKVNSQMTAALQSLDGNQDIVAQLNAAPHPTGTTICGIKSWVSSLKTSVPIENIGTFTPPTGDIAPGLYLSTVGHAVPATQMSADDNMQVSLFNFPKGSTVNVQLIGGSTDAASKISTSIFQVRRS